MSKQRTSRKPKNQQTKKQQTTKRVPIDAESQILRWQKYDELKANKKAKKGIHSNLSPVPNRHERKKLKKKGVKVGEWTKDLDVPPMDSAPIITTRSNIQNPGVNNNRISTKSQAKLLLNSLKEQMEDKSNA